MSQLILPVKVLVIISTTTNFDGDGVGTCKQLEAVVLRRATSITRMTVQIIVFQILTVQNFNCLFFSPGDVCFLPR